MADRKHVTLIPGYLAPRALMWPLARTLESVGFETEIYGYRTRGHTLEELAQMLAQRIVKNKVMEVNVVAHSLGALILLQAIEAGLLSPMRVLCLAPPVEGASLAKKARATWAGRLMSAVERRAAHGIKLSQTHFNVGVISGAKDIWVRPEETEVPGATHLVVPFGHNEMLFKASVHDAVRRFMVSGTFEIPNPGIQVRL